MNKGQTPVERWVNLIAQKELPAIASTVKILDKFSDDDKSSLPMLSKSILHDQALSSCILKLVNNSQRVGLPKITTISRATVILGLQAVKNVCLTATLVEALFESDKLTPLSYQKLSELMARSFYAGVIAKMLVSDYNEDTQEEVYLAAMLYTIGETAVCSIGGALTEKLYAPQGLSEEAFDEHCEQTIGCHFNEISKGLAQRWSLGKLLEKSLDRPEQRTPEIKVIYLANKLSAFITSPTESMDDFTALLEEVSLLKRITVPELKNRISQCRTQAIDLLSSFGAASLEINIKPLPVIKKQKTAEQLKEKAASDLTILSLIQQLTKLTKSSNDINQFIQYTLDSLIHVFDFSTTKLYLYSQDKQSLTVRFNQTQLAVDHESNAALTINLTKEPNLISYMEQTDRQLVIENYRDKKWLNYIPTELEPLVKSGPTVLALVQINQKSIGVISGSFIQTRHQFHEQLFNDFSFIIEHLNMCLSLISK